MKKAYAKPTATKVDFEYKDQVIAKSGDFGTHASPTHPDLCQYTSSATCTLVHSLGHTCEIEPHSLNLNL
mgnify:CR=1 FL=1